MAQNALSGFFRFHSKNVSCQVAWSTGNFGKNRLKIVFFSKAGRFKKTKNSIFLFLSFLVSKMFRVKCRGPLEILEKTALRVLRQIEKLRLK